MDDLQEKYKAYCENGFFFIRGMFDQHTIDEINASVNTYVTEIELGVSFEKNGMLRAVHGMHLYSDYFSALAKNETFIRMSDHLLNGRSYIHQSKINLKQSIAGDDWPWHQDFIFWNRLDFIPTPNMLTIAILLDDADYLSGPLWFIPKTHNLGELSESMQGIDPDNHSWESDVSKELSYQVPDHVCRDLQQKNGVSAFTGKAGDVVVFHSRLVHGSTNNMSANDRKLLLFTYNEIKNVGSKRSNRPEFLCSYP
jgi:ectoine hydroxylase